MTSAASADRREFPFWYNMGRQWGAYQYSRSEGLSVTEAIAAAFAAQMASIVIQQVEEAAETAASSGKSTTEFPVQTALEKLERYLPTHYPVGRLQAVWPPFWGERVPLGGDVA